MDFCALAFVGIGGSGIVALSAWHEPITLTVGWLSVSLAIAVALSLMVIYASLTAGLAWAETRGPEIEIGPLLLDIPVKIFYFWVATGEIPATVRFRVISVLDSTGEEKTERSWQGHWRGKTADFDGNLPANDRIQYGLLGVSRRPSGNMSVIIFSKEKFEDRQNQNSHSAIFISRDVLLEEQGDLTITVSVDCRAPADGQGERPDKTAYPNLVFTLSPNPASEVRYCVAGAPS